MSAVLNVVGLGRMAYEEALTIQRRLAAARIAGTLRCDLLLLVEHPPVVTLGRSTDLRNLLTPIDQLEAHGIEVHDIERGGDVTYHGPGQLVGYTIYDLHEHRLDLHWFMRQLEHSLIRALDTFGIRGERREGLTGVWTNDRKIASMGIHVKQWVTWHGFALNVSTHLPHFALIVPCGINGVHMTSITNELGGRAPRDTWGRALDAVVLGFAETFDQRPQAVVLGDIVDRAETHSPT
ncbi:MAG TPA: lipoyl(octanoyl) transferase LipB [Gemmatimonadales bacterium]|jgi:lipoyl(octanoyl) transferase